MTWQVWWHVAHLANLVSMACSRRGLAWLGWKVHGVALYAYDKARLLDIREYNALTKGESVTMNPAMKERLIHELVKAIDGDEPPGLAAHRLARAAVSLVQERDAKQALRIAKDLEDLDAEYERPLLEGTEG